MLNLIIKIAVLCSLAVTRPVLCLDTGPIQESAPPPMCTPCECVNNNGVITADCSNRNLQIIPTFPVSVVDINLDDNSLFSFDDKKGICELYKDLKKVSLARNVFRELHAAFAGCENLEEIDLTGNSVTADSLSKAFLHLKGLVTLKGLTVSGTLTRDFFSSLKKLQHLHLSYGAVSFPADLFAELSKLRSLHLNLTKALNVDDAPLQTSVLEKFHLSGSKIRKLPESFFSNLGTLTTLDLDLPELNSLKWPNQQLFSSLKHLSIRRVWQVDVDTLASMTSLQTLQLNGIDTLVEDSALFSQQQKLEVLEIISCRLKKIPPSWFSKLESLCDLNLTDNHLNNLKPDALAGLSNLRNLLLTSNRIDKIPPGFLKPVVDKLENLSLNKNMLTVLTKEDFPLMENLRALDVGDNSLSEFDLSISQHMPNLVHLQLQNNVMTTLTGSLVAKTQRVNISYNLLENVPKGLLVESMMDLDLSGNMITLPVEYIMGLENLKELTIYGMYVKCDCTMQRMIKSKAVHGGKCENESSEKVPKNVGEILNELLCEVTTTTVSSMDTVIAYPTIMERSVNDSDFHAFENDDEKVEVINDEKKDTIISNFDNLKAKDNNITLVGDLNDKKIENLTYFDNLDANEKNLSIVHNLSTKDNSAVLDDLDANDNLSNFDNHEANHNNDAHFDDVRVNDTKTEENQDNITPQPIPMNNQTPHSQNDTDSIEETIMNSEISRNDDNGNKNATIQEIPASNDDNKNALAHEIPADDNKNATAHEIPVDYNDDYKNATAQEITADDNKNATAQEITADDNDNAAVAEYTEQNMTHRRIILNIASTPTSTSHNKSKSSPPHHHSNKILVAEKPLFIDDDDDDDDDEVDVDSIVYPVITIFALIMIVAVIVVMMRVRHSGSHRLDHRRRNVAADDDQRYNKMVMTELGKTPMGQEVVVM